MKCWTNPSLNMPVHVCAMNIKHTQAGVLSAEDLCELHPSLIPKWIVCQEQNLQH